jgi:hypothetical protein
LILVNNHPRGHPHHPRMISASPTLLLKPRARWKFEFWIISSLAKMTMPASRRAISCPIHHKRRLAEINSC